MANRSAVVNGSVAEASTVFADAVRTTGGTLSPHAGGQPIRFSIKLPGNIWEGKSIPYEGTANVIPLSASQTRIDLVVACSSTFYLYLGLAVIFMFLFAHWLSPLLMLIGLVAIVWFVFQAAGPWAEEIAHRVITAVPPSAIGAAGGPGTVVPMPTAPTPHPGSSPIGGPSGGADIPDQLRKLGELHAAGVLTDEEFQAKKTELLKRL